MREKAIDEEGEDDEEGPIRTSTSNANRLSKGISDDGNSEEEKLTY
jgi:hypothetical protein